MTVSIIIIVYNVEQYILQCLKSVANQTMTQGVECIIVDNCGQDKSIEIAEQFISNYHGNIEFSILHHEQNKGLSDARNTGMSIAKGEYVYFLDSDDEISTDRIESLTRPLDKEKFDMIVGDFKVEGTDRQFHHMQMTTGEVYYNEQIPTSYFYRKWSQTAWNKLYSMDLVCRENLQFKEGLIHEDELWSFEFACWARSVCCVKHETYLYKIREI